MKLSHKEYLQQLDYFEGEFAKTAKENAPRRNFLQGCIDMTNQKITDYYGTTNNKTRTSCGSSEQCDGDCKCNQ